MISNQNCFAANFGYNGEIPFPTVSIGVETKQSLENYDFESYCKCFYVFVGGKYVQDMKKVMEAVDEVTKTYHGVKPIAMFLIGKYTTDQLKQISSPHCSSQ